MADDVHHASSSFKDRARRYATNARAWSVDAAHGVGRWPWVRIGVWAGGTIAALLAVIVLFLTFADWNAFKGPIARMASAASGREIVINGDLDVDPWSLTPRIHVTDLIIGNPQRYRERGDFAQVREADASVQLLPLFIGRFEIVKLDLQGADVALYRDAGGVGNWAPTPSATRKAMRLPAIQQFTLNQGHLRYVDDKRHMVLNATFNSHENATRTDPGRFALMGEGQLNGRPFSLDLNGAALINVRRDQPYGFNADIRMGSTRLEAQGAIRKPFDFTGFYADVTASGSDLADLYYLIGLTLPNTPPYRLAGHIDRNGPRYVMTELGGRVGDSDLHGQFSVTQTRENRPYLEGALRTASLDFDDLMTVLGGAPSTQRGETASAEQRAEAQHMAAVGRLLPDAPLDIHRVRNMDARVTYSAARVRSDRVPLRGMSLDISLDHGLLRLDPMTLQLTQGQVGGALSINAREDVPLVNLDVRLTRARLESFLPASAITGSVIGRARLTGRGAAVRQVAANADGEVGFVVPRGEIREALAELTGINVVRGLGLALSHDEGKVDVRCGVAHFRVHNGIAQVDNLLLDTENMRITGGGTVSLRDEGLDLRLRGQPKEPRLIRIAAPITLRGPLRAPRIGVDAEHAASQAGIGAALATIAAPLAAVLPFIDLGLADDADCQAVLATANGRPNPRAS